MSDDDNWILRVILTTCETTQLIGIQMTRDRTMIVPTMLARINNTATRHTVIQVQLTSSNGKEISASNTVTKLAYREVEGVKTCHFPTTCTGYRTTFTFNSPGIVYCDHWSADDCSAVATWVYSRVQAVAK